MFFTTKDKEEDVAGNIDQFNDSYARDTTVEELQDVSTALEQCYERQANRTKLFKQMGKGPKSNKTASHEALEKLTESIQERTDAGWTLPLGWLFKSFTLHFLNEGDGGSRSETLQSRQVSGTQSAKNIARFAGAAVTDSLKSSSITHIVVNPETPASDISSIRQTLSTRKKVPHIVTIAWIEESWKEKTIMDEERKLAPLFVALRCQL
jgi:DNA ligase-4